MSNSQKLIELVFIPDLILEITKFLRDKEKIRFLVPVRP